MSITNGFAPVVADNASACFMPEPSTNGLRQPKADISSELHEWGKKEAAKKGLKEATFYGQVLEAALAEMKAKSASEELKEGIRSLLQSDPDAAKKLISEISHECLS